MGKTRKDARITKEKNRLHQFYKGLDASRSGIAAGLIERAAFMRVQCEDLEAFLSVNGWTEKFRQGIQEPYDRARPQGQTYNTLNSNYQKIIKQLNDLLPQESDQAAAEELFSFVGSRK